VTTLQCIGGSLVTLLLVCNDVDPALLGAEAGANLHLELRVHARDVLESIVFSALHPEPLRGHGRSFSCSVVGEPERTETVLLKPVVVVEYLRVRRYHGLAGFNIPRNQRWVNLTQASPRFSRPRSPCAEIVEKPRSWPLHTLQAQSPGLPLRTLVEVAEARPSRYTRG
jgi:hypothetical protein